MAEPEHCIREFTLYIWRDARCYFHIWSSSVHFRRFCNPSATPALALANTFGEHVPYLFQFTLCLEAFDTAQLITVSMKTKTLWLCAYIPFLICFQTASTIQKQKPSQTSSSKGKLRKVSRTMNTVTPLVGAHKILFASAFAAELWSYLPYELGFDVSRRFRGYSFAPAFAISFLALAQPTCSLSRKFVRLMSFLNPYGLGTAHRTGPKCEGSHARGEWEQTQKISSPSMFNDPSLEKKLYFFQLETSKEIQEKPTTRPRGATPESWYFETGRYFKTGDFSLSSRAAQKNAFNEKALFP